MLTEEEAFESMRYSLMAFWKRGGSHSESELVDLLSRTNTGDAKNSETNDPAQWVDWSDAVRAVKAGERAEL